MAKQCKFCGSTDAGVCQMEGAVMVCGNAACLKKALAECRRLMG